jgi:hypothetical protein
MAPMGRRINIDPELKSEMFLPPPDFDHINYLVVKGQNGMNIGIFFRRVCDRSIKLMTKALAYPLFCPDINLGRSANQLTKLSWSLSLTKHGIEPQRSTSLRSGKIPISSTMAIRVKLAEYLCIFPLKKDR